MNIWERNRRMAEQYRQTHPPGTRIVLLDTSETLQPVPIGTRGTIHFIDDQSQLHMKWDNGRSLAVIPSEDSFRKLTKEEIRSELENGKFDFVEMGDTPALYCGKGYSQEDMPEGLYCYYLKETLDRKRYEAVQTTPPQCFSGIVITTQPLPFEENTEIRFNPDTEPDFTGEYMSLEQFNEKYGMTAGQESDETEDMTEDNTGPVMGM